MKRLWQCFIAAYADNATGIMNQAMELLLKVFRCSDTRDEIQLQLFKINHSVMSKKLLDAYVMVLFDKVCIYYC